jgi:hypothetical protein
MQMRIILNKVMRKLHKHLFRYTLVYLIAYRIVYTISVYIISIEYFVVHRVLDDINILET